MKFFWLPGVSCFSSGQLQIHDDPLRAKLWSFGNSTGLGGILHEVDWTVVHVPVKMEACVGPRTWCGATW